jgi:signal transduction histidine kinase
LDEVEPSRQPPAVERTAYVLVADAIDDAQRRGATYVSARVHRAGDRLAITVEDDGAQCNGPPLHLADRVGALGGTLESGTTSLRAELPCG